MHSVYMQFDAFKSFFVCVCVYLYLCCIAQAAR